MSCFNPLCRDGSRWAAAIALVLALAAAPAGADQWNDRTIMKFSAPVMVPGATLQPGAYVFQLVNPDTSQHTIQIKREDTGESVTIVHAVPIRRAEPVGDNVLKFNPTEPGTPPALKAWFSPGSIYGHQFVYSDEEARSIAQRTKTVVLSGDVSGSDASKGSLRVYDASGANSPFTIDPDAAASWESWRKNRHATASAITGRADMPAEATAPMMDASFKGQRVSVDSLEDDPSMYIGKTISVDAEVEDVYGPRLFTIDEPNWGDLEGEVLVYVPTPLAALVKENDRVTVTGEVKRFVQADFKDEWGWLGVDDSLEVKLGRRPVVVASQIVGGNSNSALILRVEPASSRAGAGNRSGTAVGSTGTGSSVNAERMGSSGSTGTSGTITTPIADLTQLATGGIDMVGRRVDISNVRIESVGNQHGLFARAGDRTVYILPAVGARPGVAKGQTVSVEGTILQMPRFMKDRLQKEAGASSFNDAIYIYATDLQR